MRVFTDFTPGKIIVIYERSSQASVVIGMPQTVSTLWITDAMQAIGYTAMVMAVAGVMLLLYPMAYLEFSYRFGRVQEAPVVVQKQTFGDVAANKPPQEEKIIIPETTEFNIVIPKIGVNSTVYTNVDPSSEKEYLPILQKGLAHAKGTYLPGEGGNIYIFGHSTDSPWNVTKYNAQFYLLKELVIGDEIEVYSNNVRFRYIVTNTEVVYASDVSLMKPNKDKEVLVLQTCYPPGTTLMRLIVRAEPVMIN